MGYEQVDGSTWEGSKPQITPTTQITAGAGAYRRARNNLYGINPNSEVWESFSSSVHWRSVPAKTPIVLQFFCSVSPIVKHSDSRGRARARFLNFGVLGLKEAADKLFGFQSHRLLTVTDQPECPFRASPSASAQLLSRHRNSILCRRRLDA